MYEFKGEELFGTETLLLGRTTYEGFSAAWPEREGDFADKFNTMEKVVVSTTLSDPTWANTTVVRDLDASARSRRATAARSRSPAAPPSRSPPQGRPRRPWNLMVFPVVLGSGKRLFPTDAEDKQKVTLRESRTYTNGVQLNIFDTVR